MEYRTHINKALEYVQVAFLQVQCRRYLSATHWWVLAWKWDRRWPFGPWYVRRSLVNAHLGPVFEWRLWRRRHALYACRWCIQPIHCSPSSSDPRICPMLLSWGASLKSFAWRGDGHRWHQVHCQIWCPIQALRPNLGLAAAKHWQLPDEAAKDAKGCRSSASASLRFFGLLVNR